MSDQEWVRIRSWHAVKVLTTPEQSEVVAQALREVSGVVEVLISAPGPDAALEP